MSHIGIGAPHEALSSWDSGSGVRPRWLHKTGQSAVYLYDYLQRTSNVSDAIALLLAENSGPLRIIFPARDDLVLTRMVGDGLGGDGLRSDLTFEGHHTVLNLEQVAAYAFWFPHGTSRVCWKGIHFYREDPPPFHIAIAAYSSLDWLIEDCVFEAQGIVPDGDLLRGGPALIGATGAVVTKCKFIHAQCGFAGYGYSSRGCRFISNRGIDVSDFLVSNVTGVGHSIRDFICSHNSIEGMMSSGGIYVGSDGLPDSADVSDVIISNNTINGLSPSVVAGGGRRAILFRAGATAERIIIDGNIVMQEGDQEPGCYGITATPSVNTTLFRDLRITNNICGRMGNDGTKSVLGIDVNGASESVIRNNTVRGNRGMQVVDPVDVDIDDNEVYGALGWAISVTAATRHSSFRARRNKGHAVPDFRDGLGMFAPAGFNIAARIEGNRFTAVNGASIQFFRDSTETCTVSHLLDNEVPQAVLGAGLTVAFARDNAGYP